MKKQEKKKTIIDAAIVCIEEQGVQDLTVREITEKAAVNTASINYYFGSKDRLIKEALDQHFENLLVDWEVILERQAMDFNQGLKALLYEIMEETRQHPNLMKAHLYDPLIYNQTNGSFSDQFDRFLQFLLEQKRIAQPEKNEKTHQMELIQLFSGVMFPGLLYGLFDGFGEWDLEDTYDQQTYIDRLINRVLVQD